MYKTYLKPILIYEPETWKLTKKDSSRVQEKEMKFLRSTLRKTRRYWIKNTEVREIQKLDKIQDEIEDNKMKRYGLVKRLNTGRISRQLFYFIIYVCISCSYGF